MNYYTSDVPFGYSKEIIQIINERLTKRDTLYVIATDYLRVFSRVPREALKCDVVFMTDACKIVEDRAFDLDIKVCLSYYPMLDYDGINLHGNKSIEIPGLLDVCWSTHKRPMSIEDLLSLHFGHCHNPYVGFISNLQAYRASFAKFLRDFNDNN